jgi:hypothetical protein
MNETSKDLGPTEKITKLDAARRQLHTAIRLYFENRDLVSVLTLSRASHDILRTLLISKGGEISLRIASISSLTAGMKFPKS